MEAVGVNGGGRGWTDLTEEWRPMKVRDKQRDLLGVK